MRMQKRLKNSIVALLVSVFLLTGCGAVDVVNESPPTSPDSTAVPSTPAPSKEIRVDEVEEKPRNTVTVSTTDQFLAAINSGTDIILEPGIYDLTLAKDYGKFHVGSYSWEKTFDGFELVLNGIENLSISGQDVSISIGPRYSSVFRLENCRNISFCGIVAGHSDQPGECSGDVLYLQNCKDIFIDRCWLYGCGAIGVHAVNCERISVTGTDISDCSFFASFLEKAKDVSFDDCRIYGMKYDLFEFSSSDRISVTNCEISDNNVQHLLSTGYSTNVQFLGNAVHDNSFEAGLFSMQAHSPVVDHCRFEQNSAVSWYDSSPDVFCVNEEGRPLDETAFETMVLEKSTPLVFEEQAEPDESGESAEIHVQTVDEFLAAIAPNHTIYLDAETYDLSTASDYGAYGGRYYTWRESYDGPELIITNVDGLSIVSGEEKGTGHTTICAIPRHANVLSFEGCDDLRLSSFTAGHTEEPGDCSGGVIYLRDCRNTRIQACRLYGCGTLGIEASNCDNLSVQDSEIYDCSSGGVVLQSTDTLEFTRCDIHDLGGPAFSLHRTSNAVIEGDRVWDGVYNVESGKVVPFTPEKMN